MLFLACSSQWNVVGLPMGMEVGRMHYLGLRYEGCAARMSDMKISNRARAWADLRAMEIEAASVINRAQRGR